VKRLQISPEDEDVLEHLAIQDEDRSDAALHNASLRKAGEPNVILMPNAHYTFSQSAHDIFTRLATTNRYFFRGVVVEFVDDTLIVLTPAAFRSRLDRVGIPLMAYIKLENGDLALRPKRCSRDSAEHYWPRLKPESYFTRFGSSPVPRSSCPRMRTVLWF
jgi:hypothetical protein